MGVEIGDTPIIPRFFERAINDYVEEKYYNAMKSRDSRMYRPLWTDAYQKLTDLRDGSWNKARKRIKSMDSKEKESMEEYISSMYHK
jgi:glutamyl-tRNA reductase